MVDELVSRRAQVFLCKRVGGGMRKFKPVSQAQRFVTADAAVHNLFNLGRHLVRAEHYRYLGVSAFAAWNRAVS